MEALNLFGIALAATIGFCLGAAAMYFGGLIVDWKIEKEEKP